MGLSQSLHTGYSGLYTHQKSMDNIGNNLANINTVGYKKSDFHFSSIFKQAVNSGAPAEGDRSATNPKNVGLGVTTGAILGNFQQGNFENTNNPLDCAISGNGFFMVSTANGMALTRSGSFYLDHMENPSWRQLCAGDGLPVQGWMAQNGVVSPSQSVGNIYLPALGDPLPGRTTTEMALEGILPAGSAGSEFAGLASLTMKLAGNLTGDQTLQTSIFANITRTDGSTASSTNSTEEVKVAVAFTGPATGVDGNSVYAWSMTTVDWPQAGDPGIQIYPAAAGTQESIAFHADSNANKGYGAGQVVYGKTNPGAALVQGQEVDAEGNRIDTSFRLAADFSLDISRLTNLADSPTGNTLQTWHVDGNPTGTMARTINSYDEFTDFQNFNGIIQPARTVAERPVTLYLSKTATDNQGSDWSWSNSRDSGSGGLRFNVTGDFVSGQQNAGGINYDFSQVRTLGDMGRLGAASQNGYRDGTLEEISIDANGKIWGQYSNDANQVLAQLAIGTVPNASGLSGASGTLFYPGSASGAIMIGVAGDMVGSTGMGMIGAGTLMTGYLESSNVDLAKEFSTLIQTERGYQFNSRIISTSNEMLQTAVQLKT